MSQFRLFHTNANLRTIKEFAEFNNVKITSEFSIDDFFELNRQTIFEQLSINQLIELRKELQKEEIEPKDLKVDMTLPCPCTLFVEQKYVTYNLFVKNNNLQYPTKDVIAFQTEEIEKITKDPSAQFKDYYRKTIPGIRVLGWFKSLYYYDKERQTTNDIDNIYNTNTNFIDLSKYITTLNTSVNAGGGSFSISLPHVPLYVSQAQAENTPAILNDRGNVTHISNMIIDAKVYDNFQTGEDNSIYVKSSLFQQDYFSWIISANDLLFISFNSMPDVTDDDLSDKVWDMIALVDTVTLGKDANGNTSINVTGRDLMKIITDDSRIFFPNSVASGTNCPFDNTEAVLAGGDINSVFEINRKANKNERGELPFLDGTMPVFAMEPNDFSIDFVIKAVVSKLANMRIVPEFLFTAWGDKRTTFADFKPIVKPTDENAKTTS